MRRPARTLWPELALAILLAVAALGIPRLRTDNPPATAARPVLPSGTAFAISLAGGRAVIDLPHDGGRDYLLILSSLGEAAQQEEISLMAMPGSGRDAGERKGSGSCRLAPVLPLSGPPRDVRSADLQYQSPIAWNRPASARAADEPDELPHSKYTAPPPSRTFRLHVTDGDPGDARQYTSVTGHLAGFGQHIQVYIDAQLQPGELAAGLAEEIVQLFDNSVCPQVCGLLGRWNDVDEDGRFTVLVSPWLGRLQGGKTSVGGFVRQADFSRATESPLSNRCDMLYLNSSLRPGRHLETLLLHEFTHAVCFSQRGAGSLNRTMLPREEDWLNEAIAHAVETRFGGWSNLDYRISRYLNEPGRYPLIVPDYYTAGLWRNHGCRGATSLFLEWLQQRYGEQVLRQLVREPASGTASLERVTGVRFPALYRRFTLALADAEPGRTATAGIRLGSALESAGVPASPAVDSLQGVLNGWGLAGPRRARWNTTENPSLSVELTGTSTAWIEIHGSPAPARGSVPSATSGWQLVLEGRPGSRLQATLVPLERKSERFELLAASHPVPHRPDDRQRGALLAAVPGQPGNSRSSLLSASSHSAEPGVVTAGYSRRFRIPAPPSDNLETASGSAVESSGTGDSGILVQITHAGTVRAGTVTSGTVPAAEVRGGTGPAGADLPRLPRNRTAIRAAVPKVLLLACEWHEGDERQKVCLTGAELAAARVNTSAAAGNRPAISEYRLQFPRHSRQEQTAGRTLILKAIVRDSIGEQHMLWSTLREEPQGEFSGNQPQELVSETVPDRR